MSQVCTYRNTLKWKSETNATCCSIGKVKLPELADPAEPLRTLLLGESQQSKHLVANINKYNSCFQMTSFGTTKEIQENGLMPTLKVQGQVYHHGGSLHNMISCYYETEMLNLNREVSS